MNRQKIYDNTGELLELKQRKSFDLFLESINLFKLSLTRCIILGFIFIILFVIQKFVLFPNVTAIKIMSDLTVNLNTIIIPIFAVIITGYAIFQALSNGKTLVRLISVNHEGKKSTFSIYNLYFYGIAILYLSNIFLNFICLIIFRYLPEDWSLEFFSRSTNEYISATFITFYLIININLLIEMKSFIHNLFQVFITNATSTAIDYLSEEQEKKE